MESGGGPAVASKRTAEDPLSLLLSLDFLKKKSFIFRIWESCPAHFWLEASLDPSRTFCSMDILPMEPWRTEASYSCMMINSLIVVLNEIFAFFNLP